MNEFDRIHTTLDLDVWHVVRHKNLANVQEDAALITISFIASQLWLIFRNHEINNSGISGLITQGCMYDYEK